jgi:hypothetical protein
MYSGFRDVIIAISSHTNTVVAEHRHGGLEGLVAVAADVYELGTSILFEYRTTETIQKAS